MIALVTAVSIAAAVNTAAAAAGYRARTVSCSGAVTGAIIGVVVAVSAGWTGWTLLVMTFGSAALSSRAGLGRKAALGIDEPHGGRRGAANAAANTGLAAAAAALSVIPNVERAALVAFVAALAAAGSDTVASEIGKAYGRRTFLITTFRPVPPGTSGAVSLEGTVAGVCAAASLAVAGVALGLVVAGAFLPLVFGATAGAAVESALGATVEPRRLVNNHTLNFLNTAIAAAVAVAVSG